MTRIRLREAEEQARGMQEKLEMSTAEIGLTVRTTNCLEERGIFTVRDLLNCTREDLLSISNFGEKTLEEVYKALEGIGSREVGCLAGMTDALVAELVVAAGQSAGRRNALEMVGQRPVVAEQKH